MANCEAPGSLNGFKIIHNNLTNPYFLMLKWEGSPKNTFGVKNIQKSELKPLHKFEQDTDNCFGSTLLAHEVRTRYEHAK